jgi:hypothetical protein
MAQIQSRRLQFNKFNVDSGVESGLAYPATAAWAELSGADQNGTERKIQIIFSQAAPGTDFNNAPNGSLCVDIANFKLYIKTAASTWTVVGSQS